MRFLPSSCNSLTSRASSPHLTTNDSLPTETIEPAGTFSLHSVTSASQSLRVLPLRLVNALGHGLRPLISLSISVADLLKSILPKDLSNTVTCVACDSSCGLLFTVQFLSSTSVSTRSSAPITLNLSKSDPPVSFLSSLIDF